MEAPDSHVLKGLIVCEESSDNRFSWGENILIITDIDASMSLSSAPTHLTSLVCPAQQGTGEDQWRDAEHTEIVYKE